MEPFRLRFGVDQRVLTLVQSTTHLGIRAKPGQVVSDLSSVAGWLAEAYARAGEIGAFRVVDVRMADESIEDTVAALRRNDKLDAVTNVFHTSSDQVPFVPSGRLFVRFAAGLSDSLRNALLAREQLRVIERRGRDDVVAVTAGLDNPVETAMRLQQSPNVLVAEPSLTVPIEPLGGRRFQDPAMTEQWHLENRGDAPGLQAGEDARVVKAWQRLGSLGSPDVIVAVLDGGCEVTHLEWAGKVVAPFNFENGSTTLDADPHGTACAGLAIASANRKDIVGVAPGSRLMPIQFGKDIDDIDATMWFDHARENGAAVVNCSWKAKPLVYELPTPLHEAIHRCATESRGGKGSVICFAAGNKDVDINNPGHTLNGFAIHPDVLAVSAMTSMGRRSNESAFGERIAVCAPSSGVGGRDLVTTDLMGADGVNPDGNVRDDFGETSGAAAVVSGVAALVLAACPTLSAGEVRDIVRSTARPVDDLIPEPPGSHSKFVGFGCVNADAAVKRALEICHG